MNRRQRTWIGIGAGVLLLLGLGVGLFFALRSQPESKSHDGPPREVAGASETDLLHLLISARSKVENLHPNQALPILQEAVRQYPTDFDARLDLANVYLLLDQSEKAIEQASEALKLDDGSPAAYYVLGCGNLRLQRFEPAVQALSQAKHIDPQVAPVSFQLGRAHQGLSQWEAARDALRDGIKLEAQHPSAHYVLAQVLLRLGDRQAAERELTLHREVLAKQPDVQVTAATYERSVYTRLLVPFRATEEPSPRGIKVRFTDATAAAFGGAHYRGPIGILSNYDLFVVDGDNFRILSNTGGHFEPRGPSLPGRPGERYTRVLVGDINNDGTDDVMVLGEKGTFLFLRDKSGAATDISKSCGLADVGARTGALADLDFTGKLGLWIASPDGNALQFFRNQGNLTFKESSAEAGAPKQISGARQLAVADWNGDDLPDLLVGRENHPPLLLRNQRTGPLTEEGSPADWPAGNAFAIGDLNNDLRPDLVVARPGTIEIIFNGIKEPVTLPTSDFSARGLYLVDYDNDGWLDIIATGDGMRVWRNLGGAGFREVTAELGLDKLVIGHVNSLVAADFDNDGDTDLLLDIEGRGLQLLRNDGGNSNRQLKLRLVGKRSNASGLGSRVTLSTDGWRTSRTYDGFPLEIGTGGHMSIDSLTVHWYDLAVTLPPDVAFNPGKFVTVSEIQLPTGSCPYLYAWDGTHFRFVSDILGASPAGLPASAGHLIDADTDELVGLGNDSMFVPKDGAYVVQITDELREILYLDEAKLVALDHPAGTEVHPTSKLRPGKPFPPPQLVTLSDRVPLLHAQTLDGVDVTEVLAKTDGKLLSPARLRIPQLRGLAEPHGVVLDFGPLPTDGPLVLAMTGWLHFGGGMANIAGSENPDLPFPFPLMEVETIDGWKPVDVVVGAPAGKTKTILVDLTGKLPAGARRLKITTAFEIHWDRIALFRGAEYLSHIDSAVGASVQRWIAPSSTDLHWRGYSRYADQPWFVPLTPMYEDVVQTAPWFANPSGWCTRYGAVDELVAAKDDALVILNSGDELTVKFPTDRLPPKRAGMLRDFFLLTSGWDKDADYHVVQGGTVEPLPWHGMDDQLYGKQERPKTDHDGWIRRYNTRWVGPQTLRGLNQWENMRPPPSSTVAGKDSSKL